MSAKVNLTLSPNLRLLRRGSATPLERTEKKSPLLRRGSWSPNLRLLRRSSDSSFLKDSQSLVRNLAELRNSYVRGFCWQCARAVDGKNAYIHSRKFIILGVVYLRMLQSQSLGKISSF